MKIIKQSAVQDHCQDCTGGQSLSDHHTFLDESAASTLLMTVRPNTILTFAILITEVCSPLAPNENFFRFFLEKQKERRKKGLEHFLKAITKY